MSVDITVVIGGEAGQGIQEGMLEIQFQDDTGKGPHPFPARLADLLGHPLVVPTTWTPEIPFGVNSCKRFHSHLLTNCSEPRTTGQRCRSPITVSLGWMRQGPGPGKRKGPVPTRERQRENPSETGGGRDGDANPGGRASRACNTADNPGSE